MEDAKKQEKKGLNISAKSFITAIVVIFALMVVTFILTFIIPGGQYQRIQNADGNWVIDTSLSEYGTFEFVQGGIAWWKWLLSPFLVLGSEGNVTLIAVIAFLLVIGGVFNGLDKCGLIKYMLDRITNKFGKRRYVLMSVVVFFFMAMGSMVGSFEEVVPLVPIVVALAVALGWDALTGIAMSLLATGCGFAAGVCNPFTVGTAQELAGLEMFSGVWLRLVAFVLIYALLMGFLLLYTKKKAKPAGEILSTELFVKDKKMDAALICFVSILGTGIATVLCSAFIPVLQDVTLIIVAVTFLAAGVVSILVSGAPVKQLAKDFGMGVVTMLPAVLMILMASSIKYTMEEAKILDTALYYIMPSLKSMPAWVVVLVVYAIVLVMNFFIPSGSAKAFMLIPLMMPIAEICGLPMQLLIVAFAFGDGFSNVFYPTNPALLISLGVAETGYGKWVKFSGLFQLCNLVLTCGVLLFGYFVGYGW